MPRHPGQDPARLISQSGDKKALRTEGFGKTTAGGRVYFVVLTPRLNFEVNFSTRPAVSTKRFSPV